MTQVQKRQPLPFGDYLLLDRVGIGGMAEVWRAKMFGAEGLGRLVALKRILPHFADDDEFVSMFLDEGRIGLQLLHTNVAQAFELGQIGPYPFLSQEYIPGKSLGEICWRTPARRPSRCRCRWSATASRGCARGWTTRTARRMGTGGC